MTDENIRMIGRYEIEREIGRGGMAIVYKAFDPRLERTVAIKLIRNTAFSAEAFGHIRERFEREAKALARLDHPNIVKIHDFGEHAGAPYLVMDYLEGVTLKEVRKPLRVETAARLIRPVAEALEYVHRNGLLHRDVKPSNIMITKEERVILTDFGIAKWMEDEGDLYTLTGTGIGIGTPEYMAPEQGRGKRIDERSDMYSLTIVFYELITGKKPYGGDTPLDVLMNQVSEPIPDPRAVVPEISESVKRFLDRAMAKKPEDRYPAMADYVRDLDGLRLQSLAQSSSTTRSSQTAKSLQETGEQTGIQMMAQSERTTDSSIRFGKTDFRKVEAAAEAVETERSRSDRKRGKAWLIPLAAAAVLAGIFLLRGWISPAVDEDARAVDGTATAIERSVAETQTAFPITRTQAAETFVAQMRRETEERLNLDKLSAEERANVAFRTAEAAMVQATYARHQSQQMMDAARIAQEETAETARETLAAIERGFAETQTALLQAQTQAAQTLAADRIAQESTLQAAVAEITMTAESALRSTEVAETQRAMICAQETQSAAAATATAENLNPYADVKVGDIIEFGRYEQDNDLSNGAEAIEWLVLDVTDGNPLLVSRYGLDVMPFNDYYKYVNWRKSTIRSWLNKDFLSIAFDHPELELLSRVPSLDTLSIDRVFLLSFRDLAVYRPSTNWRKIQPTAYAAKMSIGNEVANRNWWLRTTGNNPARIMSVDAKGAALLDGIVITDNLFVRPAFRLQTNTKPIDILANKNNLSDLSLGDIVSFGCYEQDNDLTNGDEAIEWQVMEIENNSMLLVSRYGLDLKKYHDVFHGVTWETCSLRTWLNDEFYKRAFSTEERELIQLSDVKNANNSQYGTSGGNETVDFIFLLSLDEAGRFFPDNNSRRIIPTDYRHQKESWWTSRWLLRSPGAHPGYVAYVDDEGVLEDYGAIINSDNNFGWSFSIRPALRIRIKN